MVGEDKVHFFDIYSTLQGDRKSWAPNPLRSRAVLNYKKIPYTESYISPRDIKAVLQSLNVPPNPAPAPIAYTFPAITHKPSLHERNPTGATINDTWAIAEHLEKTFSSPSHPAIFPTSASRALAVAVSKILESATGKGISIIAPKVVDYLDDKGREFMNRTRKEMWGKEPKEFAAEGEALEEAWRSVEGELNTVAEMLAGSADGPFFEGTTAGYADLILLAWLGWVLAGSQSDFERAVSVKGGELRRVWEAGKQWIHGWGEECYDI